MPSVAPLSTQENLMLEKVGKMEVSEDRSPKRVHWCHSVMQRPALYSPHRCKSHFRLTSLVPESTNRKGEEMGKFKRMYREIPLDREEQVR